MDRDDQAGAWREERADMLLQLVVGGKYFRGTHGHKLPIRILLRTEEDHMHVAGPKGIQQSSPFAPRGPVRRPPALIGMGKHGVPHPPHSGHRRGGWPIVDRRQPVPPTKRRVLVHPEFPGTGSHRTAGGHAFPESQPEAQPLGMSKWSTGQIAKCPTARPTHITLPLLEPAPANGLWRPASGTAPGSVRRKANLSDHLDEPGLPSDLVCIGTFLSRSVHAGNENPRV